MLIIRIIALPIMYYIFVNTVDRQIRRRMKDEGEERKGEEGRERERETQRN